MDIKGVYDLYDMAHWISTCLFIVYMIKFKESNID